MKLKYVRKFIWQRLGRCYYCGHRDAEHKPEHIRECKHAHCDCFGFDKGPTYPEY